MGSYICKGSVNVIPVVPSHPDASLTKGTHALHAATAEELAYWLLLETKGAISTCECRQAADPDQNMQLSARTVGHVKEIFTIKSTEIIYEDIILIFVLPICTVGKVTNTMSSQNNMWSGQSIHVVVKITTHDNKTFGHIVRDGLDVSRCLFKLARKSLSPTSIYRVLTFSEWNRQDIPKH